MSIAPDSHRLLWLRTKILHCPFPFAQQPSCLPYGFTQSQHVLVMLYKWTNPHGRTSRTNDFDGFSADQAQRLESLCVWYLHLVA